MEIKAPAQKSRYLQLTLAGFCLLYCSSSCRYSLKVTQLSARQWHSSGTLSRWGCAPEVTPSLETDKSKKTIFEHGLFSWGRGTATPGSRAPYQRLDNTDCIFNWTVEDAWFGHSFSLQEESQETPEQSSSRYHATESPCHKPKSKAVYSKPRRQKHWRWN